MTLNLWNVSGDWRARRAAVVAWVRRLSPDVVCLQEVMDDGGDRNTARWLAAELGGYPGFAFGGLPLGGTSSLFGPAVLSRWPVASSAAYPLPNAPGPTDVERVLLHVRTGGLDVFSVHLTSLYESGALRERQCVAIDRLVAEHAAPLSSSSSSSMPPVLAGDFNAEPDSAEIRFLCGLGSLEGRSTYWQDAWRVAGGRGPGWTWDNRNPFAALDFEPDRRIDYVFVGWRHPSGAGRVESCRVVCDRAVGGVFPSDHFGVLAEIST
jgi:endonuclease/exonuclease/phosphatase family metal-dependent hydrolase